MCTIIAEMDNTFSVLVSPDIVNELVIETMRNIERGGQEQYSLFVAERLEKEVNLNR